MFIVGIFFVFNQIEEENPASARKYFNFPKIRCKCYCNKFEVYRGCL